MSNKTWILSLALITTFLLNAKIGRANPAQIDAQTCSYHGISLLGKVKIVESAGDISVSLVESFPDLKVNVVEHFADECGKWQFVESSSDFTVTFVESFADLKIKFVNAFPGIP